MASGTDFGCRRRSLCTGARPAARQPGHHDGGHAPLCRPALPALRGTSVDERWLVDWSADDGALTARRRRQAKPAAGRTPFAPATARSADSRPQASRLRRARYRTGGTAGRRRLLGAERPRLPQGQRGGAGAGRQPGPRRAGPYGAAEPRPRRRGGRTGTWRRRFTSMLADQGRASWIASPSCWDRPDPTIWIDHVMGTRFHVPDQRMRPGGAALAPGTAAPAGPGAPGPRQRDHPVQGPAAGAAAPATCWRACAPCATRTCRPRATASTVVETDDQPRARAAISGLSDGYIFGFNPFIFNKILGRSILACGEQLGPRPKLTCVLDAGTSWQSALSCA